MRCAFPEGVLSLDEFWDGYASRFDPRLREQVLLAGRENQAKEVIQRLASLQPDRLLLAADSTEEALAFAVAAVRKADAATRAVLDVRSIVVTSQEAARDLLDRELVFFPTQGALQSAPQLSQYGPTIIASGRRDRRPNFVELRRPLTREFGDALEQLPMPRGRAAQLAAECGRSVTVLMRRIPAAERPRPSWAEGRPQLLPALLAGAWDSANEHDRAVLSRLAGEQEYFSWQASIQPLLLVDDPPLEHEGTVWKVRAPVDAFVLLAHGIGSDGFGTYRTVCTEVLATHDANLASSASVSVLAGPGLPHSDWLRLGLATTLLLIATLHGAAEMGPALAPEGGAEKWVNDTIAALPGLNSNVDLLASLRGVLPILAEAAPYPFVAAMEHFLWTDSMAIRSLFEERIAFISPDSDHVWLLWALETLAWNADLLPRVAVLLARLAALDPGGKLSNRPITSLRNILLPWLPNTNADIEVRLGVLNAVIRTEEEIGWQLSLLLLPEYHAVGTPTARPQLREAEKYSKGATSDDRARMYRAASSHAMRLAGDRSDRLRKLVKRWPDLAPEGQTKVLEQLGKFLGSVSPDQRHGVWAEVRDLAAKHETFSDADWSLKGKQLAALKSFIERWVPEDLVLVALPLFDKGLISRALLKQDGETELEARRNALLQQIVARDGEEGVLRLAQACRTNYVVAQHAVCLLDINRVMALVRASVLRSNELRAFTRALSGYAFARFDQVWLDNLVTAQIDGMPAEWIAQLLLGLPDRDEIWDLAASMGPEVDREYWRLRQPGLPSSTALTTTQRAVEQLLKVGRPYAALVSLHEAEGIPVPLILHVLDEAVAELNTGQADDGVMAQYYVQRAFAGLRTRPEVARNELAQREFAYLPLLVEPGERSADLTLFDIMAEEPEIFVKFLKVVFRRASQEDGDQDDVDQSRWRAADNVLEAFRRTPGLSGAELDGEALKRWSKEVLRLSAEADRADIGAQFVGKVLAHVPDDPADGAWPIEAMRELLEDVQSEHVERGIDVERFNMRGTYTKGVYDGGEEERGFARQARHWASACAAWPRTSAMLHRIAQRWDREAEREDISARQRRMQD